MSQSTSKKGNYYGNTIAESFFKTIKTELIYHNNYTSIKKAKISVIGYIKNFYSTCRRHSTLEYLTVEEFQNKHLIT
ncbi:IS3 family transposase [Flavobacterium tructae]|uniref:IS3 family transposase n=1 Tax=Flavobacterium tructae TaxID=1114873 RepID=UPI0035A99B91